MGLAGIGAAAAGLLLGPRLRGMSPAASAMASAAFVDASGQMRTISDWKGQIAVCNFWATWCAPCREEIPMLVSARESWHPRGVEVVGISIDKEENVREFAQKTRISYPLLLGGVGAVDLLRRLGNTAGALPFTVILDRSGTIAATKLGEIKRDELDGHLRRLTAA